MAWRESNAQKIKKSKRSDFQLRRSIQARSKDANERLERLKARGFSRDQFVQEHQEGFHFFEGMDVDERRAVKRSELSKELARIDRFLNARSSRISGLRESRKNTIDALNKTGKFGFEVNESNYDDFQILMSEYRNNYKNQVNFMQSDVVMDNLWQMKENLQLTAEEIRENMSTVLWNLEEMANTTMEDIEEYYEGLHRNDKGYEFDPEQFSLTDYLDKKYNSK